MTVVPDAGSTATVLVSDLSACKAYVQVIDTVLIPEAVSMFIIPLPSVCLSICLSDCLCVMTLGHLSQWHNGNPD